MLYEVITKQRSDLDDDHEKADTVFDDADMTVALSPLCPDRYIAH